MAAGTNTTLDTAKHAAVICYYEQHPGVFKVYHSVAMGCAAMQYMHEHEHDVIEYNVPWGPKPMPSSSGSLSNDSERVVNASKRAEPRNYEI